MKDKRKCGVPPYQGKEPYAFFSYCHSDENLVYPLIEELGSNGLRVWYDQGITAGADWPLYIAEKLQGAQAIIAAMSKAADESINCNRELAFAAEKHLTVLVVYLEECSVGLGTQLLIAGRQSCKAYQFSPAELAAWCRTSREMENCWGEPVPILAKKLCPAVSISIQSWVYDGKFDSQKTLAVSSDHMDAVSPEIRFFDAESGASLSEPPVHAGNYRVRAFWQTTEGCEEAEATAEFAIRRRPVSIRVPDAERAMGNDVADFGPVEIRGDVGGELQGTVLPVECQEENPAAGEYPGALRLRVTADQLERQYRDYRFEITPGTLRVLPIDTSGPSGKLLAALVNMGSGVYMRTESKQIEIGTDSGCDFVADGAPGGTLTAVGGALTFTSADTGWSVDGQPLPAGARAALGESSLLSAQGVEIAVLTGRAAELVKNKSTLFVLKSLNQGEIKVLPEGEFPCGKMHNDLWKKDVMPVTDRTMTSVHHCDIVISGGHARVHDWKSTNGTFVNGVRYGARLGSQEWVDLKDGDMLRMGRQKFAFCQKELRKYVTSDVGERLINALCDYRRRLEQYTADYQSLGYEQFDKRLEQWRDSIQELSILCREGKQSVLSAQRLESHTQQTLQHQIAVLQQKLEESLARQRSAEQKWEALIGNIQTQLQTIIRPQRDVQIEEAYQAYLAKGSDKLEQIAAILEKLEPYREGMDDEQRSRLCAEEAGIKKIRETILRRAAFRPDREADSILEQIAAILSSDNQAAEDETYPSGMEISDEATMLDTTCSQTMEAIEGEDTTISATLAAEQEAAQ